MADLQVKHGGNWKVPATISARQGGAWKDANTVYAKENGLWKPVWNSYTPAFTGGPAIGMKWSNNYEIGNAAQPATGDGLDDYQEITTMQAAWVRDASLLHNTDETVRAISFPILGTFLAGVGTEFLTGTPLAVKANTATTLDRKLSWYNDDRNGDLELAKVMVFKEPRHAVANPSGGKTDQYFTSWGIRLIFGSATMAQADMNNAVFTNSVGNEDVTWWFKVNGRTFRFHTAGKVSPGFNNNDGKLRIAYGGYDPTASNANYQEEVAQLGTELGYVSLCYIDFADVLYQTSAATEDPTPAPDDATAGSTLEAAIADNTVASLVNEILGAYNSSTTRDETGPFFEFDQTNSPTSYSYDEDINAIYKADGTGRMVRP